MYRYTAARQRVLVSHEMYQPPQRPPGGGGASSRTAPARTLVLIFIANSCFARWKSDARILQVANYVDDPQCLSRRSGRRAAGHRPDQQQHGQRELWT
jgi:hypothetical protein